MHLITHDGRLHGRSRTTRQHQSLTEWKRCPNDAAGNMTTIPRPMAPSSDHNAAWDAWIRLVTVADGVITPAEHESDGETDMAIRVRLRRPQVEKRPSFPVEGRSS